MFLEWNEIYAGIKNLSRIEEVYGLANDINLAHSLMHGRIESLVNEGGFIAYAETWRLGLKEAEKLSTDGFLSNFLDLNLNYGPVLWIAQITIHPDYRKNFGLVELLKRRVFEKNKDAKYIGWYRLKKKRGIIIPFKKRREGVYG